MAERNEKYIKYDFSLDMYEREKQDCYKAMENSRLLYNHLLEWSMLHWHRQGRLAHRTTELMSESVSFAKDSKLRLSWDVQTGVCILAQRALKNSVPFWYDWSYEGRFTTYPAPIPRGEWDILFLGHKPTGAKVCKFINKDSVFITVPKISPHLRVVCEPTLTVEEMESICRIWVEHQKNGVWRVFLLSWSSNNPKDPNTPLTPIYDRFLKSVKIKVLDTFIIPKDAQ